MYMFVLLTKSVTVISMYVLLTMSVIVISMFILLSMTDCPIVLYCRIIILSTDRDRDKYNCSTGHDCQGKSSQQTLIISRRGRGGVGGGGGGWNEKFNCVFMDCHRYITMPG